MNHVYICHRKRIIRLKVISLIYTGDPIAKRGVLWQFCSTARLSHIGDENLITKLFHYSVFIFSGFVTPNCVVKIRRNRSLSGC